MKLKCSTYKTIYILFLLVWGNLIFSQTSSIVISPSPLYAGTIPLSSSEDISFKVSNFSTSTIEVQSVSISQGGQAFSIIENPTPASLFAFNDLDFTIKFTPSITGKETAIIQIQTSRGAIDDTITGYGSNLIQNIPTFERLIGFEDDLEISTIKQASDGGYIITGTIGLLEHVNQDAYVIRTDKYGKQLWGKYFESGTGGDTYDGGDDLGVDAVSLSDGNIIIMANSDSWGPGDFSIVLTKLDANGNFIWEAAYGGTFNDKGSRMRLDSDGNIIIVGSTNNTADQTEDAHVLKVNPTDGALIWEKKYGEGGGIQSGYDIVEDHEGGYVLMGNNQQGQIANIYITKIDKNGNQQWSKTLISEIISVGERIISTSDGNFVIGGYTLTNEKGKEGYLVKVNENGELLFERSFGTNHPDDFSGVQQTSDGGYLCLGTINQFWSIEQSFDDMWLLKTDSNGNFVWEKRLGGEFNDSGTDIINTMEGGYALLGNTDSFTSEERVYFLHITEDGNVTHINENGIQSDINNFVLNQNYPNPFNPSTSIEFNLTKSGQTSLRVYNVLGQQVAELINQELSTGVHKVNFDASGLSSGLYFYRLESGKFTQIKKMILLK